MARLWQPAEWTKVCIDNTELDFNGCLTGREGRDCCASPSRSTSRLA
jgi:hypothetical protein